MEIKYPLAFKAAILEQNNKPLSVREVMFSGLLEYGQVLVRIHYSGICGKQIEEIKGAGGHDPYLPHMLGHEGSGVVIDVGPGVKKVKAGDHVVLHWMKGSGINAPVPSYLCAGRKVNAGLITTFNEYGVISENRMTRIPKEIDLSAVCLLGCAVTTGVGVILNDAKLRPGESVAVFGCGGVGLNAIQGAALVCGYPIIAVDTNMESLKLAKKFGATNTIHAGSSDVIEEIKKITNGLGAKYVVIASGSLEATEMAVNASSVPGTVYFAGVPPVDSKITINPFAVHMLRKLVGSYGGATSPDRDIPAYIGLYKKGCLKLKELISQVVALDEINDGIDSFLSGKVGRCLVEMIKN